MKRWTISVVLLALCLAMPVPRMQAESADTLHTANVGAVDVDAPDVSKACMAEGDAPNASKAYAVDEDASKASKADEIDVDIPDATKACMAEGDALNASKAYVVDEDASKASEADEIDVDIPDATETDGVYRDALHRTADAGNVYYVATSGSDQNPGTLEKPFLTLERAAQSLQAGDTCYIRGGVYRETLRPVRSGTADKRITYAAYNGERVVISGAEELSGWTRDTGSIFQAEMEWDLSDQNQIFVNGEMMTEARWPNNKGSLLEPTLASIDSGTHTTMKVNGLPGGDDYWKGAKASIIGGKQWIAWPSEVLSFDAASKTLTIKPRAAEANVNYDPGDDGRGNKTEFMLTGLKSELDTEDEWWYDSKGRRLYLWAPGGGNPSGMRVEAKRRELTIDLKGLSYIDICGIETFAGRIDTNSASTHNRLRKLKCSYVSHSYQKSVPGVVLQGSFNEIDSCEMQYASHSIVQTNGTDNRIVNSYLHDGNYACSFDGMVSVQGERMLVSHNTMCRSGRDVVYLCKTKGALIQYNDISDAGLRTSDVGMIYIVRGDMGNSVFRYNRVHGAHSKSLGMGIYLDAQTHNMIVHHNLVYDGGEFPILDNGPSGYALLFNNTLSRGTKGREFPTTTGRAANYFFGTRFYNNIHEGMSFSIPEITAFDRQNNVERGTDPRFLSPDTLDFRLKSGSPAIDCGKTIGGVTGLYSGDAPDAGAFEAGWPVWTAGHDFDNPPQDVSYEYPNIQYMNRIQNPCFEYGSLRYWETVGSGVRAISDNAWSNTDAKARTGDWGCEIQKEGSGICQTIDHLLPNTTYTFHVNAKVPRAGEAVRFGVREFGGADVSEIISSRTWDAGKNVTFTTGPSSTTATVYLFKEGEQSGYVYVDDLGLAQETAAVPEAREVCVTGDTLTGKTVRGEYLFDTLDRQREGNSRFRWLYADTAGGNYVSIPGASGDTLFLDASLEGKYIRFEVTPYAVDGTGGRRTVSLPVQVVAGKAETDPYPYYDGFEEYEYGGMASNDKWEIVENSASGGRIVVEDKNGSKAVKTGVTFPVGQSADQPVDAYLQSPYQDMSEKTQISIDLTADAEETAGTFSFGLRDDNPDYTVGGLTIASVSNGRISYFPGNASAIAEDFPYGTPVTLRAVVDLPRDRIELYRDGIRKAVLSDISSKTFHFKSARLRLHTSVVKQAGSRFSVWLDNADLQRDYSVSDGLRVLRRTISVTGLDGTGKRQAQAGYYLYNEGMSGRTAVLAAGCYREWAMLSVSRTETAYLPARAGRYVKLTGIDAGQAGDTLRVFLFDSLSSLRPLAEVAGYDGAV